MTAIKRFRELVVEKARQEDDFILSSGSEVKGYFDLKRVICGSEGAALTGMLVFGLLADEEVEAIGGEGVGGRWIVSAVVTCSQLEGKPLPGFEILKRSELRQDDPEKEGDQDEYVIKGHLPPPGSKVALADDALSTGTSVLRAKAVVEKNGCQVVVVIVLLDRQLGGFEELRRTGCKVKVLLKADAAGEVYVN